MKKIYIISLVFIFGALLTGAGKIGSGEKLKSIEEFMRKPEAAAAEQTPAPVKVDLLILVNKKNLVPESLVPDGLCNLSELVPAAKSVIYFNSEAAAEYQKMISEMNELGLTDLAAVSGYRTYKHQESLHRQKIAELSAGTENAIEEAGKIVAPPGASEHQTGLALDVGAKSAGYSLSKSFTRTPEYKWLAENCHKYGFIIRYPEDKTHITNIIFEPWHLRYVGAEHAAEIYEAGVCLEEYLSRSILDKKETSDDFQSSTAIHN